MELHGTEGHTVLFKDGRRLGRVVWIEYGSRPDQPDALIVRRRFYERPRLVRIPAAMVEAVERKTQTMLIDVAYNPNHFFLRQPLENAHRQGE
jgi:ribosomal 30S subunit maturation factor RimM